MAGASLWRPAILGVALAGLLVAACALPTPTPPPTPTPRPVPTLSPMTGDLEEGRQLYISKGCVACHGANLELLVVVNLPEVSTAAVMRQVRRPSGMMPSFAESVVSDEELGKIARFVAAALAQRAKPGP